MAIKLTYNKGDLDNKILMELSRMEHIAEGDYINGILGFSKFLRNIVWNRETSVHLFAVLYTINTIFELFYKAIPLPNYEIIFQYVVQFRLAWQKKYPFFPSAEKWNEIEQNVDKLLSGSIIKKQWDVINPFIDDNSKEHFDKNLISILDDMFQNSVVPDESVFIRDYKSIKYMYRGVKGVHDYTWLVPNPKYAFQNRWNPEGRCFVYAAIDDAETIFDDKNNIYHGEMVCIEELRAEKGDKITLGRLEFMPNIQNKKVFDLSYNDTSFALIDSQLQKEQELITNEIIDNVRNSVNPNAIKVKENIKHIIMKQIDRKREDTILMAGRYVCKTFLKMICDNIYVPLSEAEDSNLQEKEKCYGSFHVLAEYLEKRGYAGIIYPSTRTTLINQLGKNIVLFNYQDVTYRNDSLKVAQKEY